MHFFLTAFAIEKSDSNYDIAIEMLQILKQGYPSHLSVIIYLVDLIFHTLSQKNPTYSHPNTH